MSHRKLLVTGVGLNLNLPDYVQKGVLVGRRSTLYCHLLPLHLPEGSKVRCGFDPPVREHTIPSSAVAGIAFPGLYVSAQVNQSNKIPAHSK